MGRKLDALLGRNFNSSKFKAVAKLAVSRVAILKNHRQARYSHARSDVIELLNLGHHERALHRVEYVIKEENMLVVLTMIENYCQLMMERVMLIQKNKECPDELKEALSCLIFASSRCGEFPELIKIREIFTSRFGKEFAARAVELRNNCGVNPKIVQKLSSRQPSLESRLKVLKEISAENGITLHLDENAPTLLQEQLYVDKKQPEPNESATINDAELGFDTQSLSTELDLDEKLSESVNARKKYRDVAAAARDAFQSAAYAAVAARAAIELSRSESQDYDSDDDGSSSHQQGTVSNSYGLSTPNLQNEQYAVSDVEKGSSNVLEFDKIHPQDNFGSESDDEDIAKSSGDIHVKELQENEGNTERGRKVPASSSDSDGEILSMKKQFLDLECQNEKVGNEVASDDVDNETVKNQENMVCENPDDLDSNSKPTLPVNAYEHNKEYRENEYPSNEDTDNMLSLQSPKLDSLETQDEIKAMERKNRMTNTNSLNFREQLHAQRSSIEWKHLSMRTIRAQKI